MLGCDLSEELYPLLSAEDGFLLSICSHSHDQFVAEGHSALNDVEVPVRWRVKGPSVEAFSESTCEVSSGIHKF